MITPIAACAISVACSSYLRLDITNATDASITVAIEGKAEVIKPGLSHSFRFPGTTSLISVRSGGCARSYSPPNLDDAPWKFLIGKSVKFRAMPSGLLQAFPPTPDVELENNPLRAMRDGAVVLRPNHTTCA